MALFLFDVVPYFGANRKRVGTAMAVDRAWRDIKQTRGHRWYDRFGIGGGVCSCQS